MLLHERGEARQHVRIGGGKDTVAEVEDVSGSAAGAREHVESARLDSLPRPEQDGRVEIALDAVTVADRLPTGVERAAPVEPDHVAAGPRKESQELLRRTGAEVDRRHVGRREDAR